MPKAKKKEIDKKKIFIIAGEASGDVLGAKLIASLKKSNKNIIIKGVGGERMKKEGLRSLFPMQELSLMGFLEIVPHLPNLLKRIKQTVKSIKRQKPDIVITIDSPGFNFKIAKEIQNLRPQTQIIHYVAPTVWAYKENRAKKVAKLYDHILLLLPFEKKYFDKVGLKSTFIGHPIVEEPIAENLDKKSKAFRTKYDLKEDDILLCMMPGSRSTELNRLMPIFTETVNNLHKKYPNLKVIIPTLESIKDRVEKSAQYIKADVIVTADVKEKYYAYAAADLALVKSGTASLEVALSNTPMIVAYKVNRISYYIIKKMIKVKYVNLLNLVANKAIIPELLQDDCTPGRLYNELKSLIENKKKRQTQLENMHKAFDKLSPRGKKSPSDIATKAMLG